MASPDRPEQDRSGRRPREYDIPDVSRGPDDPHPDRLDPAHPMRPGILAAHRAARLAGQPGYLDPGTGLFVLTSAFLAARGTCCTRGCRHCPYVE